MGIAKGMVSFLAESRRDLNLGGKLLELGKQDIHLDARHLARILGRFGLPLPPGGIASRLDDVEVFRALGLVAESLDANAYEGATHVHDMNQPIPDALKGQYDIIYDGGTLEHVFNFPQCLKNIFDLLKPGGIVIHASPSHNHVDHGFYMFSPTVFYDYYTANKFEILKSYIFEYSSDHASKEWLVYGYRPGSIDHLSFGGWGGNMLGIFFVAKKTADATSGVAPQQGTYLRAWGESTAAREEGAGLKQKVKSALGSHPRLYRLVGSLYNKLRGKPRIIARY